MYVPHDVRHVDFRGLTGSQRHPGFWGVTQPVQLIGRECNDGCLGLEMYVFHFYEPVEQTIDGLVNRSSKWSSQRSPIVH